MRSQLSWRQSAFGFFGLGLGIVLCALLPHSSDNASIFGRYSTSYALLLAGVGLLTLLCGGIALGWRRTVSALPLATKQIPSALVEITVSAGAAALAWIVFIGSRRFAFLSDPLFLIGISVIFAGLVMLGYEAIVTTLKLPEDLGRAILNRKTLAPIGILALYLCALYFSSVSTASSVRLLPIVLIFIVLLGLLALGVLTRFVQETRPVWLKRRWILVAAYTIALGLYMGFSYWPTFRHALLGAFELQIVNYAYNRNPLAAFFEPIQYIFVYYRPFVGLQGWIYYQLFGIDYAGYQIAQIALVIVATLVLAYVIYQITGDTLIAGLTAFLFPTFIYISDLMIWGIETFGVTNIIAAFIMLLLIRDIRKWYGYGLIALLVVIAPMTRENGLGIAIAILCYALYCVWSKALTKRDAAYLALAVIGGLGVYFAMRASVVGLFPNASVIGNDGGLFYTHYSAEEIRAFDAASRYFFYAYSIGAALLTSMTPLFLPDGLLRDKYAWGFIALLALAGTIVLLSLYKAWLIAQAARLTGTRRNTAIGGLLAAVITLGFLLPLLVRQLNFNLVGFAFALQGVLSIGILFGMLDRSQWTKQQKSMAVFAAALIIATTAINFTYFRYRNLYLALDGWLVLLALALAHLKRNQLQQSVRALMTMLVIALVVVNGTRVYFSLPLPVLVPANFDERSALCDQTLDPEFVQQIATHYEISLEALKACRGE